MVAVVGANFICYGCWQCTNCDVDGRTFIATSVDVKISRHDCGWDGNRVRSRLDEGMERVGAVKGDLGGELIAINTHKGKVLRQGSFTSFQGEV